MPIYRSLRSKKAGGGEILSANKDVVNKAAERGVEVEVGSRVAFTISLHGSKVLSLLKTMRRERRLGDQKCMIAFKAPRDRLE